MTASPASSRPLGEIESPRPLRAAHGRVDLNGWCVLDGLATAPPVRLVAGEHVLSATINLPREDLRAILPAQPAAPASGFRIQGTLPTGAWSASFEAQAADGRWLPFKTLSLLVEPPAFAAAVDYPQREGVLRGRVKFAGWAFHPEQSIAELSLRYGHRQLACLTGQPREDVTALFPGKLHAGQAGFTTEDYAVAGCGPLRIRAKLSGGSIRVVATPLRVEILTDENHDAALDLRADLIGLPRPAFHAADAPPRTAQPLNILFLLPGSFAANHALHVAALANELAAAGHDCAVAVAREPETLRRHHAPAFRGLSHGDVLAHGYDFHNHRAPDVIHAWTTGENVRRLALELYARCRTRLLVHLEDNESRLLAARLHRSADELARLPPDELAALLPPDASHPRLSRDFLALADGVTVITERLREFVPDGKPCLTLWPAADDRYFQPQPPSVEFRRLLGLPPGASVLFYPGNVHAANAAEVAELYAAVRQLNAAGIPSLLIRTGFDRAEFLPSDLAIAVRPHVIHLGHIPHHHHLPALMALADFFVQPGSPDPFNDYRFPSKLPEFFALGRPVILPRTNLGQVVRHGVDAFVLDRADATGIAQAIRVLRADPALAARLSQGALAFAARHFSWRRSAEALASFYQTLPSS